MEPGLWIGVGAALVLLTGCYEPPKSMSYDQQDATRINAINALSVASNAVTRVEEPEAWAEELEGRVEELEAELGMFSNSTPVTLESSPIKYDKLCHR